MKIPFFDRLKKDRANAAPRKPAPTPARAQKSESLSKTVMPSARPASSPAMAAPLTSTAVLTEVAPAPVATAPRTVSFAPKRNTPPAHKDLPPAVALALEPRVERAVALELRDIVNALPAGMTKPAESFEIGRRILLKAAELEKGMSAGKPTVSLVSVHQQVPEIFLQKVSVTDETIVLLPFEKVLAAFSQMQVRRDQMSEQNVPQVSTPFLKATLEDNERFGIASEAPTMSDNQGQLRWEPATAETLAAAEPEPQPGERVSPAPPKAAEAVEPMRIPLAEMNASQSALDLAENGTSRFPERIPFHLPPKETGASASERVPASCGPPVSTPLPPPPVPARIPFTMPAADAQQGEFEALADERKIALSLKPILQSLPVFQLTGDPKEAPADLKIQLPLALILTQLPSGRIAIAPELFERSLPPEGRRFFTAKDVDVPVLLPLDEVLKHLPADSLRMREDQEETKTSEVFATPFLQPAKEDAERFQKTPDPIGKMPPVPAAPAPAPAPTSTLDPKTFVAQVNALPGVRACALSFSDGLNLAGHLPTELAADGLCAIAPSLLQRIGTHVLDTKLGALLAITLYTAKASITIFVHQNVCLTVLNGGEELSGAVRDQLSEMLEKLSHAYSQTETSHVHH